MDTIALSPQNAQGTGWDLYANSSGNIALNTGAKALAQDAASAASTFLGEVWYDLTIGIPYFQQILGKQVSLQFMKLAYVKAALTVPGVSSAKCFLTGPDASRRVGGQLQLFNNGQIIAVAQIGNLSGALPWWVNAASEGADGADT